MLLVLPDLVDHSLKLFIPFEAIHWAGKRLLLALANGAEMCDHHSCEELFILLSKQ